MDLFENSIARLEAVQHLLLNQGIFDRLRLKPPMQRISLWDRIEVASMYYQFFEVEQLLVRLFQKLLLILLFSQREQSPFLVTLGESLTRNVDFLFQDNIDLWGRE